MSEIGHNPSVWDIIEMGQQIWGQDSFTGLSHVAVVLTKVVGDLSAQVRAMHEGGSQSPAQVEKELGNLVTTSLRALAELRLSPEQALTRAFAAQQIYVERLRTR